MSQEVSLPLQDLVNGDLVKETVDTGENERNHLVDSHGGVLLLLQQLSQPLTTRKSLLGGSVQVGTELGEGSDLTVLRQEQLEGTGDLLHGLELGGGTDTGDGKTDVDGGADTLVEELGLQEDLAVGDGNDVGRDVSGDITTLGLNDGEGSEGATAVLVVQLSGTLEKTRVEVEDTVKEEEKEKSSVLVYRSQWRGKSEKQLGDKNLLARVGLTTGGTTKQERHLTVGNSLLGKIIVDDDGMATVITEPLTHSTASEGSNVLKRSSLGSSSGNDDRVLHSIVLLQSLNQLGDGGSLLANGNVDTVQLLRLVASCVPALLVQDRVEGDGGLTGLTVTDDQLTLATANGHHGVDGLETGLHGLVDGAAGQDAGGLELSTAGLAGVEGTLAVNGVTETVDDTAEQFGTSGDLDLGGCVRKEKRKRAGERNMGLEGEKHTI